MRYCFKCGRREDSETPLINGLCPDCYLKYRGVVKQTPVFEIVVCSKCGSWRFRDKWLPPASIEDILRRLILEYQRHFVNSEVTIAEVDEITSEYRVNKNFYEAIARAHVILGEKVVRKTSFGVRYRIIKTVCPHCMRKAGKVFNAIVQVRSARGYLSDEEKMYVRKIVSDPVLAEDIVDIIENKNGIDIKMITPVLARRVASIISRDRGAKVIETFKVRKYDPSRGKVKGVTTFSVRLPDLKKGDIVSYNGVYGVVEDIRSNRVSVIDLSTGERKRFNIDDYWSGRINREEDVEEKTYVVVARDSSTIYVIDEETGSMNEYPRLANLNNVKEGDKIKGYKIKGRLYMTRT